MVGGKERDAARLRSTDSTMSWGKGKEEEK